MLSEQGPEAAGAESKAALTSTQAHTKHLFTPMAVQRALSLLTEKEEGIQLGYGWEKKGKGKICIGTYPLVLKFESL